jgi:hypothetical protein
LGWQNTRYSQSLAQQGSQNVAGAIISAQVKFFSFNKTNLSLTGTAFPALSNPGRVYFNTNATYLIKFGNLTWNFSVYGNRDNQPPETPPAATMGPAQDWAGASGIDNHRDSRRRISSDKAPPVKS